MCAGTSPSQCPGKEEFNPTLSGRSPQSLGAPDRSEWNRRDRGSFPEKRVLNAAVLRGERTEAAGPASAAAGELELISRSR